MATLKTITQILPYTPAEVPILGQDNPALMQFLTDEFKRISFPLSTLANDWTPNYQLSIRTPTTPTALTTTIQTIGNYGAAVASKEVYATNVTIDLVAGEITFNSDPLIQVLLKLDGSVIMDRLSGSNNTSAILYITIDGVSSIIGTSFASNQTEFITMLGSFLGLVNGDSTISLGVSYGGTATVDILSGFLDLNVLGLIEN